MANNNANLTVSDSLFSNNGSHIDGGAIYIESLNEFTFTSTSIVDIIRSDFQFNFAGGDGGAIVAKNTTLTVAESTFEQNMALLTFNGEGGGAIVMGAGVPGKALTISGSEFNENNTTSGSGSGGAIALSGAPAFDIRDTRFYRNKTHSRGLGGAIGTSGFAAPNGVIDSVEFVENTGGDDGGAIFHGGGELLIYNSLFDGNQADRGGGLAGRGIFNIHDSTFKANRAVIGGGVYSSGILLLENSTFVGNRALSGNSGLSESSASTSTGSGGGIFARDEVKIINSTITGNSARRYGGGIHLFHSFSSSFESFAHEIQNSTIVGNEANVKTSASTLLDGDGGGVFLDDPNSLATILIDHSIIAGNTREIGDTQVAEPNDVAATAGQLFQVGYSLIEESNGAPLQPIAGTINQLGVDPLLGPLADNGGPTETHALLSGSPAIDAGDPNILFDPTEYDQRGFVFHRVVSGRIDIGAFEAGATSADFDGDQDVDGADFLAWQLGFGTQAPNATPADGDADNDQDVDAADLGIWQGQFGSIATPLAASSTGSTQASAFVAEQALSPVAASAQSAFAPENLIDVALATEWLGTVASEQDSTAIDDWDASQTGDPILGSDLLLIQSNQVFESAAEDFGFLTSDSLSQENDDLDRDSNSLEDIADAFFATLADEEVFAGV